MRYIYALPNSPAFTSIGLSGYVFGPLSDPTVEVCYIDVTQGHDTFQISRKIRRIYYVLSGDGCFIVDGERYEVVPGTLVEIPPGVEYSYTGRMRLLLFGRPRGVAGNDTATRWNPEVFPQSVIFEPGNGVTWISRCLRWEIFGKCPIDVYLNVNRRLWDRLPSYVTACRPMRLYGQLVHKLAKVRGGRAQGLGTCFFRNRPALELIKRLVERKKQGETLRVAVLGSSSGAEVYSIAWIIRTARPDLTLCLQAMDISKDVVEFARCGVYPMMSSDISGSAILERLTRGEVNELFDREGDLVRVRPWIREGIKWHVGDVGDPGLGDILGQQDMVVANNFLCHMDPRQAEKCLRNIARLVSHRGHLFVSGIDLDVRTRVARELGWNPVDELLEPIHEGDVWLRRYWPHHYTGLEPFNKRRQDWKFRYAAVFQIFAAEHRSSDKGSASVMSEGVR